MSASKVCVCQCFSSCKSVSANNPVNPVILSEKTCEICEISVEEYKFLCKTKPIFRVFTPKTTIRPKNEPKTKPIKANFTRNKPNSNPKRSQI
jgi:hypothetical protein